jgi:prephenate dehydrogenase
MAAADHDAAVAGVSHLPLIAAAALVEAVLGHEDDPRADWPQARALAATGWRDMTRLARGDPDMGAGIIGTNAPAIGARIRDLVTALQEWADLLGPPDGPAAEEVRDRLRAARDRLRQSDDEPTP